MIGTAEALGMEWDELVARVGELSSAALKFCSMWYPDARGRRECLKHIGVIFADDSSFANMGFCVIPNKPCDVHVRIGKNVSIAPNVTCICDSNANNGSEFGGVNSWKYVVEKLTRHEDVIISDEAWIGAGSVLLPGVSIGRCCVVGAGAVVARDTDDYGIYAGVPARKVGDVRQWEEGFHG